MTEVKTEKFDSTAVMIIRPTNYTIDLNCIILIVFCFIIDFFFNSI